jgi:hypothetical protein
MTGVRLTTVPISSQPSLRASGEDLDKLEVMLARKGIDIYHGNGGLLSLPAINEKIEALHLKASDAIELKVAVERADLGLPL